MLQYGYADFEKKGYQLLSASPFLQDKERSQLLMPLVHYVMNTSEEYRTVQPVSYTGVFTDLGRSSETPRYYIQAAGPSYYRNGSYAHGFVQQNTDENFFAEPFLQLLRTRFWSKDQMLALPATGSSGVFAETACPAADETLTPAAMDEGLLVAVLEQLLRQSRVVLRLDCQGDEAPRRAREVLLRIYECLPYNARKLCGFCTGIPLSRINRPQAGDELPAAVRLVLVDGDTELPRNLPGYVLFDMQGEAPAPPKENVAAFLQFLACPAPQREEYFRLVSKSWEAASANKSLALFNYQDAYSMQELAMLPISPETVVQWAGWHQRNLGKVTEPMRRQFVDLLAKRVTAQQLAEQLNDETVAAALPAAERLAELWRKLTNKAEEGKASPASILALFEAICVTQKNSELPVDPALPARALSDRYLSRIAAQLGVETIRVPAAETGWLYTPAAYARLEHTMSRLPAAPDGEQNPIAAEMMRSLHSGLLQLSESIRFLWQRYHTAEKRLALQMLEQQGEPYWIGAARCFDELMDDRQFPVCRYLLEGNGFDAAYGEAAHNALLTLIMQRPNPEIFEELLDFLTEWKHAESSGLWRSGLVEGEAQKRRPLVAAAERFAAEYAAPGLEAQLKLMLCLLDGNGPYAPLGRTLVAALRGRVRAQLLARGAAQPDELYSRMNELAQLAQDEPEAVLRLTAALWQIPLSALEKLDSWQPQRAAWEHIGTVLQQKVQLELTRQWSLTLTAGELFELCRWRRAPRSESTPPFVAQLAHTDPAQALCLCSGTESIKALLKALNGSSDAQELLCRTMLQYLQQPEPNLATGVAMILRARGCSFLKMVKLARPEWLPVLIKVYSDPMQGQMAPALKALAGRLHSTHAVVDEYAAAVHELDEQRKAKLRSGRTILRLLAAAGALAPMLVLWLTGTAQPGMVLLAVGLLAVQLLVVLVGFRLFVGPLPGRKGSVEKMLLQDYCFSLLPGAAATLVGLVLAILL